MSSNPIDEPVVAFGRELLGDPDTALRREWLVTNGIGGYASGTVLGVSSRSYHGLLVAALDPPLTRTVLVGGCVEWAGYGGRRIPISTNEYADGIFAPDGYRHLAGFRLEGTLPVWTYAVADALLERRLWMAHGANTTYVSYRLLRGFAPVEVEVTPLVTYRDHHILTSGQGWQMQVESQERGATDQAFEGATPLRLLADSGEFRPGGRWYWNFRYREETARALRDHGDLYAPGSFVAQLEPGQALTIVYTAEPDTEVDGARALAAEQDRQRALLTQTGVHASDRTFQQLVLAADQFIVEIGQSGQAGGLAGGRNSALGKTIIAGYHWFNDWGRDTMIALPGLLLATGRAAEAAAILRGLAGHLKDGLLPSSVTDDTGALSGHATADATLWFVIAVEAYRRTTGDDALVTELLPALVGIVERHVAGTDHGIGVDPADGLLRAGDPAAPLTWMDAKVDGWIVTPRAGKPVEINALWYNVLRIVCAALAERGDGRAATIEAHAARTRAGFRARFVEPDRDGLADVVDGPDGDDWSMCPNQILALSLPYPLIDGEAAGRVLAAVGRSLLTTFGLRSLAPDEPAYHGAYGGDRPARDGAYHRGAVWAWLIGPYAEAYARVTGDRAGALDLLRPFADHLRDAGLGTVSEIFDGDPPHAPRGAIAQAWSVAEVLRVWHRLADDEHDAAG